MENKYRELLNLITIVGIASVVLFTFGSISAVAMPIGDTVEELGVDNQLGPNPNDTDGEVEVIVRFTDSSEDTFVKPDVDAEMFESENSSSRQPFKKFARENDSVTIERQFSITNAALVTVNTNEVPIKNLLAINGVDRIHENFEIEAPDVSPTEDVDMDIEPTSEMDVTWGLQRIGVPDVWNEFDTRGDGVEVAVLDTGVDADHPDIDLAAENWAEFDQDGAVVDSNPYDVSGHGTRVSSIVAGGNESGTHIGVAPEATLLHGGIATPEGGTAASLLSGMDWAVENDVDVISMSLGIGGYEDELIEPVRNAEKAGVVVVVSSGNANKGSSSAPANVYESIAVGSATPNDEIREDSSGERIDTSEAWSDPPSTWPEEYVVPSVAAPGEDVIAADANGGYVTDFKQTSAATPHVAGTAALLRSENPELSSSEIRDLFAATATKPDDAPSYQDIRYGHGIIEAFDAMELLTDRVTVSGTVTDENETPLKGVTVKSGTRETVTDEDGNYTLLVESGNQTISVLAFGIESTETVVNATNNKTEHNIVADTRANIELITDAPSSIEPGEEYDLEFRIANVDSYTMTVSDGTLGNVTLKDGEFGVEENVTNDVRGETITRTIVTDPDEFGSLALDHEFHTAGGKSIEVQTAETSVLLELVTVGDEGDFETIEEALEVAIDGTTIQLLDEEYEIDSEDDLTATTSVTLTAADSVEPKLAVNGSADNSRAVGITVAADETTISGITINGSNLKTGLSVVDADDVHIVQNTIKESETGIKIGSNSSAAVIRNEISDEINIGLHVSGTAYEIEENIVNGVSDTGFSIDGEAWSISENRVTAEMTAISVAGVTEEVVENRLEAHEADLEVIDSGQVRVVGENEFIGNGTGIAVVDGSVTEVIENYFSGNTGVHTSGITERSIRNDYSKVNGSAILADGWDINSSLDYYGERGPEADDLDGNVSHDYYLTEPPAEVASINENIEHFGYQLEVEANKTTAVSFPGPLSNDLETTFGEFNGTIYTFDADGEWTPVTNGNETPGALDTYVLTPDENVTVHLEFKNGDETSAPTEAPVEAGWNLVGAPMIGDAETAYEATTAEPARLMQLFEAPDGSPIGETPDEDWLLYLFGSEAMELTVSPHTGYFVYATEDGSIAANTYSGMTLAEFEEVVGRSVDSGLSIAETQSETTATVTTVSGSD